MHSDEECRPSPGYDPSLSTLRIDLRGTTADLLSLDALARIRLVARRHGLVVYLEHPSQELLELATLAGLDDVLFG
jgi:STAS domain